MNKKGKKSSGRGDGKKMEERAGGGREEGKGASRRCKPNEKSVGDTGAGEVEQRGREEDGGGGGMSVGTGGREEAGDRGRGGGWYRGWRWRWQSQCPSTRTGSRRVAANDPR